MGDLPEPSTDEVDTATTGEAKVGGGKEEQGEKREKGGSILTSRVTALTALVAAAISVATYFSNQRTTAAEQILKDRTTVAENRIAQQKVALDDLNAEVAVRRERVERYKWVFEMLKPLAKTQEQEAGLRKDLSKLALDPNEQAILTNLPANSKSPAAEVGREIKAEQKKWPVYVAGTMVTACVSRGGVCFAEKVTLGGVTYTRGVIYTQSFPQAATATIQIPEGARSFSFIVGNYTGFVDCGGQRPMVMSIAVDGHAAWGPFDASAIRTGTIPLPPKSRFLVLRGDSGDGDTRCDDAVWVNTRFE
jgi:hypothetical protein